MYFSFMVLDLKGLSPHLNHFKGVVTLRLGSAAYAANIDISKFFEAK